MCSNVLRCYGVVMCYGFIVSFYCYVGPYSSKVEHWTSYLKLPGLVPRGPTFSTCSTVCFRYIKFVASSFVYEEKRFINTALHYTQTWGCCVLFCCYVLWYLMNVSVFFYKFYDWSFLLQSYWSVKKHHAFYSECEMPVFLEYLIFFLKRSSSSQHLFKLNQFSNLQCNKK